MFKVSFFSTNTNNEEIKRYLSKEGYIFVKYNRLFFLDSKKNPIFKTSLIQKSGELYRNEDKHIIFFTKSGTSYRFSYL